MKNFVIIRHGMSHANSLGKFQGHQNGPLADGGKKQALQLSEYFKNQGMVFDKVYSSDLIRARETALISTGKSPEVFTELREIFLGDLEGRKVNDVKQDQALWDIWMNQATKLSVYGVEDLFTAQQRVWDFILNRLRQGKFKNAAFVTHGGPICLFLSRHFGDSLDLLWQKYLHDNTAFVQGFYENHLVIKGFNLKPHLLTAPVKLF